MNLFYSIDINNEMILLSEDESHHCMHVLRNNIDDNIIIFDGKGREYICRIIDFHKKQVRAQIINSKIFTKNFNYTHLIISPIKSQDRIEWLIEKSIEIGVDRISFIKTERTERNKLNINRINKIAISAMKQSRQHYLPTIDDISPFYSLLKTINKNQLFIAHLNNVKTKHLAELYTPGESSCILIGPEGDFSNSEVDNAVNLKFIPVSLGSSILRTETAAIYALSTINILNESRS
tara:strand:+ start:117 stop:824 length:708 start_codon:yes stop_codon:yes gene_type:complete